MWRVSTSMGRRVGHVSFTASQPWPGGCQPNVTEVRARPRGRGCHEAWRVCCVRLAGRAGCLSRPAGGWEAPPGQPARGLAPLLPRLAGLRLASLEDCPQQVEGRAGGRGPQPRGSLNQESPNWPSQQDKGVTKEWARPRGLVLFPY